jgi:hypothetical protein
MSITRLSRCGNDVVQPACTVFITAMMARSEGDKIRISVMPRMSVAEDRPTSNGNSRPSGPKPFSGDLRSRLTICVQRRPASIVVDRGRESYKALPGGKYFFDSS